MKIHGCTALVTGASAGIGQEFARQLAAHARTVVLIARREERLVRLRDELIAAHPSVQIYVRRVDLCDSRQIRELCDWLTTEKIIIDLLINNAGLGDLGTFDTADAARLEEIVLVNVNALTLLTRALLPGMISRRNGGILNVSSCAGFLPIPDFAVYAASKAYVTSFSEALRVETRGTGVTVTALCPGPVHTEFTKVAAGTRPQHYPSPEWVHVPATDVARAGLDALEQDRAVVIPGIVMKVAMFFTRLTPMPLLRLAGRFRRRS